MADTEQPAVHGVKKIEEIEGGAPMVQPSPGGNNKQARGLQAMSEKDVNEYMGTLLEAQQPPPGMAPLEAGALAQFKGISQQQGNVERRLTRAQNEVEGLKSEIARLQGQSEAYVNLLVLAEDSRRVEAKSQSN